MKNWLIFLVLSFSMLHQAEAQNENTMDAENNNDLPYHEIPDYPETFTAATVAARMIDGLGFRYYWATESLRKEDLDFKPNAEARTTKETLDHIYGLSKVIVNAVKNQPNISSEAEENFTFEQLRAKTLGNIKVAADLLRSNPEKNLTEYEVIFKRGENTSTYPFWNLINGPIADAIWHVGQVVSFRRSSGNPINPKVSLFNGQLRD